MANSQWVTFSFKCHKVHDADLIELLTKQRDRSSFVRRKVRQALRMPAPVDPDVLSPALLHEELEAAVETIVRELAGADVLPRRKQRRMIDVNENGDRIPDF